MAMMTYFNLDFICSSTSIRATTCAVYVMLNSNFPFVASATRESNPIKKKNLLTIDLDVSNKLSKCLLKRTAKTVYFQSNIVGYRYNLNKCF